MVGVYDANTVAGAVSANLIATVAINTVAILNSQVFHGIVVSGAGPTAISFQ